LQWHDFGLEIATFWYAAGVKAPAQAVHGPA